MAAIRDSELTRSKIVDVTADEMRRHGYKATSLSDIIAKADISKGALYHHFKNKLELAYAAFEEVFVVENINFWKAQLVGDDPLSKFCEHLSNVPDYMTDDELECGCPVNTISQEMSAEDEGFRERTLAMYQQMQSLFLEALKQCEQQGMLRKDLKLERCALFLLSSLQGITSIAKASRDRETIKQLTLALQDYVNSLRKKG